MAFFFGSGLLPLLLKLLTVPIWEAAMPDVLFCSAEFAGLMLLCRGLLEVVAEFEFKNEGWWLDGLEDATEPSLLLIKLFCSLFGIFISLQGALGAMLVLGTKSVCVSLAATALILNLVLMRSSLINNTDSTFSDEAGWFLKRSGTLWPDPDSNGFSCASIFYWVIMVPAGSCTIWVTCSNSWEVL